MYLAELVLGNFRKYGGNSDTPGLSLEFNSKLNFLVGENDTGTTSI